MILRGSVLHDTPRELLPTLGCCATVKTGESAKVKARGVPWPSRLERQRVPTACADGDELTFTTRRESRGRCGNEITVDSRGAHFLPLPLPGSKLECRVLLH